MKRFAILVGALATAIVGILIFANVLSTSAQVNVPCYRQQRGAKSIAGSGCEYEFLSGSILDVQSGTTFTADDLTLADDLVVTDDVVVTGILNVQPNEMNIGVSSILTSTVTFASSGAIFTVTAGELWMVHEVLLNVTTNFDCTGDNCTLIVGDDADTDGFLVLADAALQTADTEFTGSAAGWQGLAAATKGVYLDEVTTNENHSFIYAGAQTIDIAVGGTSPVAGAGVIYLRVTRIR